MATRRRKVTQKFQRLALQLYEGIVPPRFSVSQSTRQVGSDLTWLQINPFLFSSRLLIDKQWDVEWPDGVVPLVRHLVILYNRLISLDQLFLSNRSTSFDHLFLSKKSTSFCHAIQQVNISLSSFPTSQHHFTTFFSSKKSSRSPRSSLYCSQMCFPLGLCWVPIELKPGSGKQTTRVQQVQVSKEH